MADDATWSFLINSILYAFDNQSIIDSKNHSTLVTINSSTFFIGDLEETVQIDEDDTRLSPALLLSFTIALSLVITLGVLGNLMVIFALVRTRAHNITTTNAYILNLSIADLLFLIFCVPFQGTVYILNDWPFGKLICKAAHYCQYYTMFASIWLLTVMSIDRYLAIGHPLKSVDWRSPGRATRICVCVWAVSAAFALPWLGLYSTQSYITHTNANVTACYDHWTQSTYIYRKWLFFGVVATGFVVPSSIIFCMAVLVARSIRTAVDQPLLYTNTGTRGSLTHRRESNGKTALSGQLSNSTGRNDAVAVTQRRKRVVYLVFALALVFIICWLPQNFMYLWQNFYRGILQSMRRHYRVYFIIKLIGHMLTYLNSTINPILYSLASGQFRNRLAHALLGGTFISHPPSNRGRQANGAVQAAPQNHNGNVANGNIFRRRSKANSFQPLLFTNHKIDDELEFNVPTSVSRRSSRGVNVTVATPLSPQHCTFDQFFAHEPVEKLNGEKVELALAEFEKKVIV